MGMIEFQVYNEKMKESRTIYSHEVSKGSLCRCGMLIFLCASGILALPSLLYPFPSFPLPLSTYFFPIICLGKEIKENQFTHTQLNHLALALALYLQLSFSSSLALDFSYGYVALSLLILLFLAKILQPRFQEYMFYILLNIWLPVKAYSHI